MFTPLYLLVVEYTLTIVAVPASSPYSNITSLLWRKSKVPGTASGVDMHFTFTLLNNFATHSTDPYFTVRK